MFVRANYVNSVNMIFKTIACFCLFSFSCLASNDIQSEEENFERPCRLFDMFCIRQFFVKHSHCKEALGPAPDPLYRDQLTAYFATVNLTFTSLKAEFGGINGRVVEFYFNKKTDKLVLAVDFSNFTFGSNENHFRFHRRGKEPIETVDFFNATFQSIVSTIIIPNLKDLQIQDSEVFTYDNELDPIFVIGPNAFISSDPIVAEVLVAIIANVATLVKESFITSTPFFIASFIKYNICDFGIEIL